MLIQSNGGKVYAVLANNANHELAVLPGLTLMSTSIFLSLRCRFRSLAETYFDPMLVPKRMLVSGIERSEGTLRTTLYMNTGFSVEKVGAGFPNIVAKMVYENAHTLLLPHKETASEGLALYAEDRHPDFQTDFAKLVLPTLAPIYPPKDFSDVPVIVSEFDLMLHSQNVPEKGPASPFSVLDGKGAGSDADSQQPSADIHKMFFGTSGPGNDATPPDGPPDAS